VCGMHVRQNHGQLNVNNKHCCSCCRGVQHET
jgi:hypothetical protein